MINEIYDYINSLQIIDTHEHLAHFESKRTKHDVICEYLSHYFSSDLISAGLPAKELKRLCSNQLSVEDKWKIVKDYWAIARHTGYGQSLDIAAHHIYGIDGVHSETITALNDAHLASYNNKHFKKVLKDMCKIKVSILTSYRNIPYDKEYFLVSSNVGPIICPRSGNDLIALEEQTGVSINTFDNYLEACEVSLNDYSKVSSILKCNLAYTRSLNFMKTTKHEAELAFNSLLNSGYYIQRSEQAYSVNHVLSNYLFRFIVSLAQEKKMVMQIHTGLQEGNGNIIHNSNPSHLNEIFLQYPKMRFDIFHIGYPFHMELGTLCKMFPNVYIDMCWAHIISPVTSRKALSEWLELFPYTKINGFGGDYAFVDGVYGHLYLARKNIAMVLSEKVKAGLFDVDEACRIGKAILYDNPARLFGIE